MSPTSNASSITLIKSLHQRIIEAFKEKIIKRKIKTTPADIHAFAKEYIVHKMVMIGLLLKQR